MLNNTLNDGVIRLENFARGAKEGLNNFLILQAKFDQIQTKKGELKDVLRLQVQLTDPFDSVYQETLSNYLIFIDYGFNSLFHQFIQSALLASETDNMLDVNSLVGMGGTVEFSRYQPEGTSASYPRLNKWNFLMHEERVSEALAQYAEVLESDAIETDLEEMY